jgi:predicted Rossmann-fold nucleotide-binding protein
MMETRRVLIAGVIGGSGGVAQATLDMATALGREICRREWTLVTGGDGSAPDETVKDAAMAGCEGGRRLGILRTAAWQFVTGDPAAYLHANAGNGRNLLTGGVPDVVFVFPGGAGTLSEIAAAALNGRRIVFVGSHASIEATVRSIPSDNEEYERLARTIAPAMRGLGGPADAGVMLTAVEDALRTGRAVQSTADFAAVAKAACDQAADCPIGSRLRVKPPNGAEKAIEEMFRWLGR